MDKRLTVMRMRKLKKVVVKGITLIVLLLCMATAWFYLGVLIPHRTVSKSAQWDPDYGFRGEMPRKKIRDACHKILRNWFAGDHDTFLALKKVGNRDSVPYLIRALKWQNVIHRKDIANGELVECTYGHCIDALAKLTGMDFEMDYEAWLVWWEQTGRHLPFDEEKGHLVLQDEE